MSEIEDYKTKYNFIDLQKIKCCGNCEYKRSEYDMDMWCENVTKYRLWVEFLSICDNYKELK